MATFTDPAADAAAAHQELRGLAHATRRIDDPSEIYAVLGSLTLAAAAFEQTLHQLAASYDRGAGGFRHVDGDPRKGRAAAYRISWELHRAGEIMRQVAATLSHAPDVEGGITYNRREPVAPAQSRPVEHGPRL